MNKMRTIGTAIVEGKAIKVGDIVSFKADIEQSGKVIGFRDGLMNSVIIVIENEYGFSGDYIGGDTVYEETADRCWLD